MSWKDIFRININFKDLIIIVLLVWNLIQQYLTKRKQKRELSKQLTDLKKEFWRILRDFKPLSESDTIYSFYKILERAKMDFSSDLSKILILNDWFLFLYQQFYTLDDMKMLNNELTTILRYIEEIFENFCNRKEAKELYASNSEFKNLYNQLKGKYNFIIANRLQSFFKKASEELNIDLVAYFKPLPEL
jgi:hypothetical protein